MQSPAWGGWVPTNPKQTKYRRGFKLNIDDEAHPVVATRGHGSRMPQFCLLRTFDPHLVCTSSCAHAVVGSGAPRRLCSIDKNTGRGISIRRDHTLSGKASFSARRPHQQPARHKNSCDGSATSRLFLLSLFPFFVRRHNQNFYNITRVARILISPVDFQCQLCHRSIKLQPTSTPVQSTFFRCICVFSFAGRPRNLGGGVEVGHTFVITLQAVLYGLLIL